jgi:DNA-binding NarL/FixJ family response regulator
LDIGLPKLDGLAAARQIRKVSPKSKILFVSQESSAAVVREAMEIGAGFLVKTDAGTELLAAVVGVMSGEQFLSTTAQSDTLEETTTELAQEEMQ